MKKRDVKVVLDASALLAYLQGEPGSEVVEKALDRATSRVVKGRPDGPGAAQDPTHAPATDESRIPLSDIQRVVDHLLSEERETA